MLQAAGYPDTKGALMKVAKSQKVPHPTLSRWARSISNPPPSNVVRRKKIDLEQAITSEMDAILAEMNNARDTASYASLATAFGIMFDKRQLLTGGATEHVDKRVIQFKSVIANDNRAD
jgi:hypothetical protein